MIDDEIIHHRHQVKLIAFPSPKVHESVVENEDGTYTIFIDCNLSNADQRRRYVHALLHIVNKDFEHFDADKAEQVAKEYERLTALECELRKAL